MSGQHLLPDAVVAFVDGELSPSAYDRAAAHMVKCQHCAAEIIAQRQARSAVRSADTPSVPAGLLATLQAIPDRVDTSTTPDGLAVSEDGQLVAVQRPDRVSGAARAPLGSGAPLGSSAKLGEGDTVLGGSPRGGRRAAQGAGVVVSGLVLGALALVNPDGGESGRAPVANERAAEVGAYVAQTTGPVGSAALRAANR